MDLTSLRAAHHSDILPRKVVSGIEHTVGFDLYLIAKLREIDHKGSDVLTEGFSASNHYESTFPVMLAEDDVAQYVRRESHFDTRVLSVAAGELKITSVKTNKECLTTCIQYFGFKCVEY